MAKKKEEEHLLFLKTLQKKLWVEGTGYDQFRGHYTYLHEKRGALTETEFEKVKEAAPYFIVEPVNACMGFNFGLNFYVPLEKEAEEFALGHGIKLTAEPIFAITGAHFDTRFAETWVKLSPLSHNKENEEKLQKYGFEPLREEGYYDY